MNWIKDNIIEDLTKIISYDNNIVIEVEDKWEPAEHYCSEIYLTISDLDSFNKLISICGFIDDGNISDSYNPDEDIEYVQITDQMGVGLSKRSDKRLRELYFKVVDYFNQFDVEIVDNLQDYF